MSDNHYFMEQELCNGRMNDKIVDKQTKRRQPKHWNEKRTRTESVVVARRGIMARVDVTRSHDDASTEPLIDGGFELLEGLSSDARRALLDEAPPRAMPPPAAAVEAPAATCAGSLSFSSRKAGPGGERPPGRRKRPPLPGPDAGKARKADHSGPLSFAADDDD